MDQVRQVIAASGLYDSLFDVVRLVDPLEGIVWDVENGQPKSTGINCVEAFKADKRCKFCSSLRALYSNKQVVKLEYKQNAIFLVISIPIKIGEHSTVAELVKDITETMAVDRREVTNDTDLPIIIDNLNKKAVTDQLTTLLNRRYIDDNLPAFLENTMKIGSPLSIAMVDIDHFKQVNDTYGHTAGDFVLKNLASVLSSFIRQNSDFVARYGGEEFLLCFPGAPQEVCREICERIRMTVEQKVFLFNDSKIPVTISVGVASSEELKTLTQEEIVQLADSRLYLAKETGRNKVVAKS